jgi:hypothetical protein
MIHYKMKYNMLGLLELKLIIFSVVLVGAYFLIIIIFIRDAFVKILMN